MSADVELKLAQNIWDGVKEEYQGVWDELEGQAKTALYQASQDVARLSVKKLSGENVSAEMDILAATIENWTYVGQSAMVRAFHAAVDRSLSAVGAFLGEFAGKVVQKALDKA